MKIQYSIWKRETGTAGGKAKNDIFDIASDLGFIPSYKPSNKRFIRIIQQFLSLNKFKKEGIFLLQYPAVDDSLLERYLKLRNKKAINIALIHDLKSIQGNITYDTKKEFRILNEFDYLISHNKKMTKFLYEQGYKGKCIDLNLFDYLHDSNKRIQESEYSNTICFAGNLDKSSFVKDLARVFKYKFNLYGINKTLDLANIANVFYKGLLGSEEIVYLLEGDYGLIWDGDSLDSCVGIHGEYLKYNNPHKLSLYIAAGKPVITWKEAAISDFVLENNIGYVVDSLEDLNNIDLSQGFQEKKANVLVLKEKIARGEFLKEALAKFV